MTCRHICECSCLQRCVLPSGHEGRHRYQGDHLWPELTPRERLVRAASLGRGLRFTASEAIQLASEING